MDLAIGCAFGKSIETNKTPFLHPMVGPDLVTPKLETLIVIFSKN